MRKYEVYGIVIVQIGGFQMRIIATIAALTAVFGISNVANAATVTLDFTAPNGSVSGTYEEDGFTVNELNSELRTQNDALLAAFFSSNEMFSIERTDGGLFSLTSFDFGSASPSVLSDEFTVLGFRGGMEIADFGSFSSSSLTFQTVSVASALLLDQIKIASIQTNNAGIFWNDFILETSEIPLPAALPLFLAGAAGLGFMRRRKSAA